jgi:hypothetical protein
MRKGFGKHRQKPAKLDDGRQSNGSLRFPRGLNREPPCQKGYHLKNLRRVLLLASVSLSVAFASALPAAAGSDESCLLRDCSAG